MKQDRKKEIHREMYIHNEVIKQEKKILKELRKELERIESHNSLRLTRKRK